MKHRRISSCHFYSFNLRVRFLTIQILKEYELLIIHYKYHVEDLQRIGFKSQCWRFIRWRWLIYVEKRRGLVNRLEDIASEGDGMFPLWFHHKGQINSHNLLSIAACGITYLHSTNPITCTALISKKKKSFLRAFLRIC